MKNDDNDDKKIMKINGNKGDNFFLIMALIKRIKILEKNDEKKRNDDKSYY